MPLAANVHASCATAMGTMRGHLSLLACIMAITSSPYKTVIDGGIQRFVPFHKPSAPSLLVSHTRSKSFPAQSKSYKRRPTVGLYFEWVTDGTLDAYGKTRRSGAQRGVPRRTSARGFLGRPLHFVREGTPVPPYLCHSEQDRRPGEEPGGATTARRSTPAPDAPAHPLPPDAEAEPQPQP